MSTEPAAGGVCNRVLFWLIGVLSSVLLGVGANWATSLDRMAKVEAGLSVLAEKVSDLAHELRHRPRE